MTEAAGFQDVTITYVRFFGSLGSLLSRLLFGTDEETTVAAVKPA